MITPRTTRLLRVPDLKAMRAAVAQLVVGADLSMRQTAAIVPTRGAAEELRVSLENRLTADRRVLLLPELVTRAELYQRFHAGLPRAPRLLSAPEREVLLRRAAREAAAAGAVPPFRLRPGLILQMLDFYDELRRREKTLDDFERLATAPLAASAPIDRGAERLLRQTEFLCAAFSTFERLVAATGATDEHGLRSLLLSEDLAQHSFNHIVITVADRAADVRGLYGCDFDLLARVGGVSRIEVVATEALLASGFHERLHELLPGIGEEQWGKPGPVPRLMAPQSDEPDTRWFVCRDREEEMVDVLRWLHHRAVSPLERFGIVFARPLPYLYLAKQVLADGRVPYQALDSLPLSAEPVAATIDVILSFLTSQASRTGILEMLRSPHLIFSRDVSRREIAALDTRLREAGYPGGWDRLAELPDSVAINMIQEAAHQLRGVVMTQPAAAQFDALLTFIRRFERLPEGEEWSERHLRARAAILAALESLRDAHSVHDNLPMDLVELSGSVRRWIEAHTFSPRTGAAGIRLLDAASAPYSDLDELRIVGLVEGDWPEPAHRSIFYPASILSSLGWPPDASQVSAARARFQDLLTTAGERVSLSTFTLEEDAIVPASPLLEEIESSGLPVERWAAAPPTRLLSSEYLGDGLLPSGGDNGHTPPDDSCAAWLQLRTRRTASRDGRFSGLTGPRPPRRYAVSYLERYLDCPFKYFASQVLRLPEERDEEAGLTPIERGHFLHDVFESFFQQWQSSGRATITTANVGDALELFESVATRKLEALPPADRALERNYLLGSAAASGLAERAFAFEIEQGGEVLERLLEHVLEGEFTFTGGDGPRRIQIKAKADRIDLMADGTLRIIDYKLSRAPKPARALQLSIYGVIAQQALEGHGGRSWTLGAAGYVAFKEKDAFVPLGGRTATLAAAVADGQERMLEAVGAIERGEFPVKPDEPFRCQWCGYAAVCRKDYVGDE